MNFVKRLLWFSVGLAIIALALGACHSDSPKNYNFHGTAIDPPESAPGFSLTDDHGQPFQLKTQQGKVILLYFGYTHCPDICPLTLGKLVQVRRSLGPDAALAEVVFITVDPERDTAQVLQDYMARFDPTFVGLRGTWPELEPVIKSYGVTAQKRDLATATPLDQVEHSSYLYVIDRASRWRVLFSQDASVDDIVADVRYLVHEGA
jgi:protein SCO1/2